MCLKIQSCLTIWFSASFDITPDAKAAIWAKKSSFFSFYNFFVKFSEQHMGNDRVKLTKYGKIEWDEKCHYASDILFEWPHVYFAILFSYYFILRESAFLWEI